MSDPPAGLLDAVLAVQAEVTTLPKDKINPAYRGSKYTPLDTIVEIVGPLLNKHGLVWMTKPCRDEDGAPALSYVLAHAPSGEREEGTMPLLLDKTNAQGQGSAITYARRYSLCAVLNLVADDDDDGNDAAANAAGSSASSRTMSNASGPPTAPQLKLLKKLVTENKPPERTMRAMLDHVGAQEVDYGAGWTDKISKQQTSDLIEIFKSGSLPDPDARDVPTDDVPQAPPVGDQSDLPFDALEPEPAA